MHNTLVQFSSVLLSSEKNTKVLFSFSLSVSLCVCLCVFFLHFTSGN